MRLCPHLCTALNFISYDKRHDARPVPSDGNPIALTPIFCLSESDTFYLYPYPTDNGTERDKGTGPCPDKQQGAAYIRIFTCPLFSSILDIIMSYITMICYQNDS